VLAGVVFGLVAGWDLWAQYFAGYLVEKSLSVDNLFVFVIIIAAFAVPAEQQPKALTIGSTIARQPARRRSAHVPVLDPPAAARANPPTAPIRQSRGPAAAARSNADRSHRLAR
jgi:hypothetical protein